MRWNMIVLFCVFAGSLFCIFSSVSIAAETPGDEIERLRKELKRITREQDRNKADLEDIKKLLKLRENQTKSESNVGDAELEALRQAARDDLGEDAAGQLTDNANENFSSKGLSLQALNPEISITGDLLASYHSQAGVRERWDTSFRTLGLHFSGYLDPYTHFKAAVPVGENGAALGEAYMTRFGLLEGVNLTLGKFRQQFGVINRWHKHGLDQIDFPLPLKAIFGPGGLNQTGLSLDWRMPELLGSSQNLTIQITNPDNGVLFSDDAFGTPVFLGHYRMYRDLSKDLYVELGASALIGWNDEWEVDRGLGTETIHKTRSTRVYGLDLVVLWEPAAKMRYRNIEWRSELYLLDREIECPDGSGHDTINSWGFYSYLQAKVTRTLDLGVRYDYFQPQQKDYAAVTGLELSPLAVTADDQYQWQISPYITWHQSPFVKYRLQWDHAEGFMDEEPQDRIGFQVIFAIGPHKHERY